MTIRLSTSLPILEGCLNVTCVQCENDKSISPIDSAQPTMAHDADTDSDLARPPDGKHPSARNATPAMLLRSATRRRTAGHGRLGDRGGAGRRRTGQSAEGRGRRTGGGSGPATSIRNAGGAFTYRMTAETLGVRVSGLIVCNSDGIESACPRPVSDVPEVCRRL